MNAGAAARTILITGLANSGKTTLCNRLTKTYSLVANYPMTTIEPRTEIYRFHDTVYSAIDMPGINSLMANSEEELVFRQILQETPPDVIIQCVDTNRVKQSLYLTSDLLSLSLPIIICLTDIDETAVKGGTIDHDLFSRLLQMPVVEVSKPGETGLYDLKEAVEKAEIPGTTLQYSEAIERAIETLSKTEGLPVSRERICSVLSLLGDPYLADTKHNGDGFSYFGLNLSVRKRLEAERRVVVETLQGSSAALIVGSRGKWADKIYGKIAGRRKADPGLFARQAAYYSRHPVWGLLFLAAFLVIMYLLVVNVAGWIGSQLDLLITVPVVSFFEKSISSRFLLDLLVGDYGLLTLGLFNAVITVLPILTIFFFLLGLLEDIGYLPNLSVMMRRFFSRLGLSGKAVMPMILGFGCKTMATMTTRSLKSRKERLIAIYLIAFAIPCSAQLGLNFAILGRAGFLAFLLAAAVLVIIELSAGVIMNKMIRSDAKQVFIQELPPFKKPVIRDAGKKTGYRVWWFLKEAIPVFLIAALVLFLLNTFGVLALIKEVLHPLVVRWLGLPIEFVDALILMLAREEAAAGLILKLSRAGMLNFMQSVIAVVVTTMFVPCFANIVVMFKEAGVKAAVLMLIAINLSTILLGGALNWGSRLITLIP